VRKFFGYIRVSTAKQGERGVSLQEQRDAIERYAQRNALDIVFWFEERVTAAKRGRPIFNEMLKLMTAGKADGVIIHKIDRSARNLKDWADLGELIDRGIEVQFVNESLDLHSRGGRLSADIQAVVAADYVRNLREETRKGFYGRIKQGLYPLPAPVGYLDKGKGKLKEFDPERASLVRKTFQLYASGSYNLDMLGDEMYRLGLRNRNGKRVTRNGLSVILNNPFYIGLIRLRSTKETFSGSHQPLIPKTLFDRVQQILHGKTIRRTQYHDFLFRRLLKCKPCGYSLIGEQQKGHVYYRCQTKVCPTKCVREDIIEKELLRRFSLISIDKSERAYAIQRIVTFRENWGREQDMLNQSLRLRLDHVNERLNRLTDAYLDRVIEKDTFEERKASLLMERKDIEEKLGQLFQNGQTVPERIAKFLELAGSAYSSYKSGLPDEKRNLIRTITSNRHVDGNNVEFTLTLPFHELANRFQNTNSAPYRDIPRTLDRVLDKLSTYFKQNPVPQLTLESELTREL
jgi:site-specific DNA recombinase